MMLPQAKEHQEPPEAGKRPERILTQGLQREQGPAGALTLHSGPQNWKNTFLLFWATQFVAIWYCSHREIIIVPKTD